MKINFGFETSDSKMKEGESSAKLVHCQRSSSLETDSALATWMLLMLGEGELEIKSQGRFDSSQSFSQETGAIGQQTPWNGDKRPKLTRELSAGMRMNSDSTPHFFSPVHGWTHGE